VEAEKTAIQDDILIDPQLLTKNPQISVDSSRIEVDSQEEEAKGYVFDHPDS